ncbi:hypothetical protein ACFL3C_02355 [Patescibacteria group bacterium]
MEKKTLTVAPPEGCTMHHGASDVVMQRIKGAHAEQTPKQMTVQLPEWEVPELRDRLEKIGFTILDQ